MPYLTLTENLKLQLSPGLVASYDIQPGNGVGLPSNGSNSFPCRDVQCTSHPISLDKVKPPLLRKSAFGLASGIWSPRFLWDSDSASRTYCVTYSLSVLMVIVASAHRGVL